MFYDALAPYGEWIWQDEYGWVWSPDDVPVSWRPYSDGHWTYTDQGWLWESELPWGWAVFHYGRWYYSPVEGWLWVPGSEWAPAWVEWREGNGYVGWAPLPPRAEYRPGGGLYWHGDAEVRESHAWCFVPERDLLEPRLALRIEFEPHNVTLLASTRPMPQSYVFVDRRVIDRGPDVVRIERVVGHPVRPLTLREAGDYRDRRREGEYLRVYRPRVAPLPPVAERRRLPPPPARAWNQEERERRQRERAEQINRYDAEQRRALAERHAREEREVRAEQRQDMLRQHERERAEQEAEIARRRQATQAYYERRHREQQQQAGRGNPPREAHERERERR
jgi:hypothetical protein